MTGRDVLCSIGELVDATISAHDDVHAVSDLTLVHHYRQQSS